MPEPLKNMFNAVFVGDVVTAMKTVYPSFDGEAFHAAVFDDQWESRELKARLRHITLSIAAYLPADYLTALPLLREAARLLDSRYVFQSLIFPDYVELYGLDYWDESIAAIEQFTQQSTGEAVVRPFILRDQERMMAQMLAWSRHENHHVRRLSSEGCRPRLPWNIALPAFKTDPAPILPILENLKLDESEYVRRSVANNLNDIAKDNPAVVVEVLGRWKKHESKEMKWMINHALRTLIKAGHPDALGVIGYGHMPEVEVKNLAVSPQILAIGDNMTFSFEVVSTSPQAQDVVIDYVVYHMRANGELSPKVFKLTQKKIAPNQPLHINKGHSFRPITTRRYYAGEHALEIQINGQAFGRVNFELTE